MIEGLRKKLYLYKYDSITLANHNEHSPELEQLITQKQFIATDQYDVIFYNALTLESMQQFIRECWEKQTLKETGILYFAYPKLNNKFYKAIHRDSIFPFLSVSEETGLVKGTRYKFNRMVKLNDTFTIVGLKHLTNKEYEKRITK